MSTSPPAVDGIAHVALLIALLVTAAKLGGEAAVRLKQSPVLGELLAGMLLGNLPWFPLRDVGVSPSVELLAGLGVLILLFQVGLESTVRDVVEVGAGAVRVAVLGTVGSFAAGYLLVWTAFSLVATVLQRWLAHLLLLTPMMDASDRRFGGALLIVAGLYQFTPFKRACLQYCRSPAEFLTRHWRTGAAGGFYLGWLHGLYCLGCCWALMLLLFVGGVMNLWWIAALTVFVLLEKVAPFGGSGARFSGWPIIALGLWFLL